MRLSSGASVAASDGSSVWEALLLVTGSEHAAAAAAATATGTVVCLRTVWQQQQQQVHEQIHLWQETATHTTCHEYAATE